MSILPKIRLIQVRSHRTQEEFCGYYDAFKGCASLECVNALQQPPVLEWLDGIQGVILGGSPLSVYDHHQHFFQLSRLLEVARRRRVPVLGVCFGAQFIARLFDGFVSRYGNSEHGSFHIKLTRDADFDDLFQEMPLGFFVQQSHDQAILRLPPQTKLLARRDFCENQAFVFTDAPMYGVQFHPELTSDAYKELLRQQYESGERACRLLQEIERTLRETPQGAVLLQRFAFVCSTWSR